MAKNIDLDLDQKSARTLEITALDQDGDVVNITGSSIEFNVKRLKTDTTYLIHKISTDADEITISDGTNGVYQVFLVSADTSGLEPETYFYDSIVTIAGLRYTTVFGKFTINPGVTN